MKIGYETNFYYKQKLAGIGRYSYNLISNISDILGAENITLFGNLFTLKKYKNPEFFLDVKKQGYYGRMWPERKNIDLLHGVRHILPDWRSVKKIITIHDLTQIKVSGKERSKFIDIYAELARKADHIIAVSTATKQDIVDILNVHPAKISVTYLGVDRFYTKPNQSKIKEVSCRYDIKRPYFFTVGSFSLVKNTARLIKAFERSKVAKDYDLVIAGMNGRGIEEKNNVRYIGYAPDADMPALYSRASGFLFPAVHSGFGLPILEAMACGTPVLTSTTEAAPEVAGGRAVLADPYDVEGVSQGFDRLLNVSAEYTEKVRSYARKFTWKKCAEETVKAYEKVL